MKKIIAALKTYSRIERDVEGMNWRCREMGRRSYAAGIKRKDCALAKGSAARKAWTRGWDAARREAEGAR